MKEKLLANPIVKAINGVESYDQDLSCIVEEKDLDEKVDPHETFQILDADSSQQKAISAAKGGISFVMQGPPGTGKSQTIGNIISECLSQNKTVLFVSAKEVALKVVKDRLDDAKIGRFCLNLHDFKANRKELYQEINNTWTTRPYDINKDDIDSDLDYLVNTRIQLNKYMSELT